MNLPNALTLLRLILVPFILWVLLEGWDGVALLLLVAAGITDFLDGRLARRFGGTRLGRVLDPLADRLLLSGVAVVLALRELLPGWAVAVLVARDLLALLGGLLYGSRIRVNRVGKAATAVLMLSVVLVVLQFESVGEIMFYAGICLSLAAGVMYASKFRRLTGGGEL
ncbi:CDP-diacylglycerol--glycerol-3-phosphate 3-phosphatidyltransferase [Rubrobacter xylanophilus]|uniref:CDP-diacylglycerol--glycerol-3-phosphate 3-phosphatidyltransferase n=1 Tax=Rubrobacter xylanophilus TaxID=49319 RepID=A0A510HHZ9_9ACTN|nr:CDP-alcohol phosphatidyltransferase family protein [Rubrobacter xylanophilus]BBL78895.1 CDP-diacylglycerol--glycerol-3-phosphate 3-phosphatidyltransferase [Rubrobacter xylanophilus]